MAELHPDLAPLAFLVGTWVGDGRGEYPTVNDFGYREEVVVDHVGKPQLSYRQRTWHADDGRPLHAEVGYFRPAPGGRVELVLAHPTGHADVHEGTVAGTRIELATTAVLSSGTAKDVTAMSRLIEVDGDVLRYRLSMAAVGQPLGLHLTAELHRAS